MDPVRLPLLLPLPLPLLVALNSSNLRLVATPSLRGAARRSWPGGGPADANAVQKLHSKFFKVCHSTTHARTHTRDDANSVVRHYLAQRVDNPRAGHVPRASIFRGGHAALEEHAFGESPTPFSHARTLSLAPPVPRTRAGKL